MLIFEPSQPCLQRSGRGGVPGLRRPVPGGGHHREPLCGPGGASRQAALLPVRSSTSSWRGGLCAARGSGAFPCCWLQTATNWELLPNTVRCEAGFARFPPFGGFRCFNVFQCRCVLDGVFKTWIWRCFLCHVFCQVLEISYV